MFAISVFVLFGGAALAGCFHAGESDSNVIKIGALISTTGDLAAFGPDMVNAANLAAEHINAAGGIKIGGKTYTVKIVHADDGTSQTAVVGAAEKLINQERVVAIVGSLSSGVTLAALPKAKDASIPMVSPASTSPTLANQSVTGGWFFRVPPSDALQGKVMAALLTERNAVKINSIYINNDYGKGFNQVMRSALATSALGTGVAYPPSGGGDFASEVGQVCGGTPPPDSIVLIGYPDTGGSIMKKAEALGCTDKKWYFSEGLYDAKFVTNAGKDTAGNHIVAGMEGTTPHFGIGTTISDFNTAYKARFNDDAGLFAAETYEGVMWVALAIQKAGGMTGAAIKGAIPIVVNKADGDQNVTKAADALKALQDGKNIDWNGPAHNFDLDANNEPKNGLYAYWRVKTDGSLETTKTNIKA